MLSEPSLMIFSGPIVSRSLPLDEGIARAQAGRDDRVEPVGVDAPADAEHVDSLRQPVGPGAERLAVLELEDPDDTEGGGGPLHPLVRLGRGLVAGDLVDARVDVVPLLLDQDALARGDAEQVEGARVQPAVVGVAADQHDRDVGSDLVEGGDRRLDRPGDRPVPVPHHGPARRHRQPAPQPRECLVGGPAAGQVEPAGARRPHRQVGVLVPQAGDDPSAAGVELRDAGRARQGVVDVADASGLHQQVDRSDPARPAVQLDDPRTAQQEVHARNVGPARRPRGRCHPPCRSCTAPRTPGHAGRGT